MTFLKTQTKRPETKRKSPKITQFNPCLANLRRPPAFRASIGTWPEPTLRLSGNPPDRPRKTLLFKLLGGFGYLQWSLARDDYFRSWRCGIIAHVDHLKCLGGVSWCISHDPRNSMSGSTLSRSWRCGGRLSYNGDSAHLSVAH